MPKNSRNEAQIKKTIIIDSTIEKVFFSFHDAICSWKQIPALGELVDAQLHLQHSLGGQFRASGKTRSGHYGQELLGTVIALNEFELIRISGPFGSDKGTNGVLTFAFWPVDARTHVHLSYAESHSDEQRSDEWASACQQFLDALKSRAEANAGLVEEAATVLTPPLNEPPESAKNTSLAEMLDLQAHRLKVIQAVAQAVATQKQLEQQLQKKKEQADTWLERAEMAEAQKNPELAVQARQRTEQHSLAVLEIQDNLTAHTENTMTLKKHLAEVENKIEGHRQGNALAMGEAHSETEKDTGILAHQAMRFVEGLENELRQDHFESWKAVVDKLGSLHLDPLIGKSGNAHMSKSQDTDQKPYVPMPGDSLQTQLEGTYQNLQSSLMEVRRTVATAIATEKLLERQLQKNKEQENTWMERVSMAEQQNNSELVGQARKRMEQYVRAAEELQVQLLIQRESTSTLKERLSDLEREVQKAYTKKHVLISRDAAARAIQKANESLERIDISLTLTTLEQMETQVIEQEKAASASMSTPNAVGTAIDRQFFADTIATFETAIAAIRQLDQRIADKGTNKKLADFE